MGPLAAALICVAMTPGCGGPAVGAPPPSVAGFAISYERSGGLASMPRSLAVAPGRQATAKARVSLRTGGLVTTHFLIGVRQVKRLRAALERADFQAIPAPGPEPGACADCYTYDIRYRGHELSFSEANLPETLRPVVGRLEALIEAHLPFH
jgi:hypothetical protein